MSHTFRASLLLGLVFASACGASPASICARLDDCNSLATGVSATQCTEDLDKGINELTASRRADCLADLTDALANASCEQFFADVNAAACGGGGGGTTDTF